MTGAWTRYVVVRVAQVVPVLLVLLFVTVLLQVLTPGDPAQAIAGPRASDEQVEKVREELGLNDSVFVQYVRYLGNVVQGDLGTSNRSGVPVTALIGDRLEVTLWLLAGGLVAGLLLALPSALLMATRPASLASRATARGLVIALNCPPFWVALMLASTLALRTGWFPVGGFGDSFGERLHAIVLPSLTIGLGAAAFVARSSATSLRQVLAADHVVTARSLGISGWLLIRRHLLRNALPPVVTMLSFQVAALVLGAVVVEQTFGLPGLGSAMITAASDRDFPVVQGLTLLFGTVVVGTYLFADVAVAALDPRVKR